MLTYVMAVVLAMAPADTCSSGRCGVSAIPISQTVVFEQIVPVVYTVGSTAPIVRTRRIERTSSFQILESGTMIVESRSIVRSRVRLFRRRPFQRIFRLFRCR